MKLDEFVASLKDPQPDPGLSPLLTALWWDAKGDWERAHQMADREGPDAAWVHAYLHRKEGNANNAAYWYRHAGRRHFEGAFDEEWRELAEELLTR